MIRTGAVTSAKLEVAVIADPKVVEEIHQQRGQALFGFARTLGLTDEQAADAVQETMLRLWREISIGRPVTDPAAWSFRTIYRISMDEHRLRRRVTELQARLRQHRDGIAGGTPSSLDDRLVVWALVDRLPARQRQALYLRYRADLPFEAVAAALDVSAGAARTLVSRALERLRSEISERSERDG